MTGFKVTILIFLEFFIVIKLINAKNCYRDTIYEWQGSQVQSRTAPILTTLPKLDPKFKLTVESIFNVNNDTDYDNMMTPLTIGVGGYQCLNFNGKLGRFQFFF